MPEKRPFSVGHLKQHVEKTGNQPKTDTLQDVRRLFQWFTLLLFHSVMFHTGLVSPLIWTAATGGTRIHGDRPFLGLSPKALLFLLAQCCLLSALDCGGTTSQRLSHSHPVLETKTSVCWSEPLSEVTLGCTSCWRAGAQRAAAN